MSSELKNKSYRLGKYTCFAITDPKLREVWAADFRDRVLHHLLVDRLEQIWEKKFIFHSYACRSGKGAHKAIKYLLNAVPTHNPDPLFYLQVDIESFFMSIDKYVLFSIVQKHINNPDILWLTKLIIFQNPTDNYLVKGDRKILASIPKHKSLFHVSPDNGLPIGNYTSQFFANVYLNEIDRFIKHDLKCRNYFRYMDDLLLLDASKEKLLDWRRQINNFLKEKLLLNLHPEKQFLQPVSHGIDFLGYIVRPDYVLSRRRIVANFKKKLYYFNKLLNGNARPWPEKQNFQLALPLIFSDQMPTLEFIQKVQATVNSYYGHFKHADCSSLRKNLHQGYFKELKNFLEPADKTFSFFIINPAIKKFYQEKNQDY
ncbi:MAG: reverse transcriptase/maturase family protein [Patescibacteria group bacterium]|nr:reverse transcriptase/maturase family protein [Patescibacteria group bacterium]